MQHTYIVQSNNIRLRPLKEKDLEMIRCWRNQECIREWFIDSKVIKEDGQKKWFSRYLRKQDDIIFVIEEDRILKKPIGMVSLYNINYEKKEAEFGRILIGIKEALGKGYGRLATRLVCEFAFKVLELDRIYLEVFKDNIRAFNTYLGIGFKLIEAYEYDKRTMLFMSLTKDEFIV